MNRKPIETAYNGYKFRSRLEARWAVFFDTAGIEYRYEPEGFDLDGIWYLPDFFLPRQRCWLEIKPDTPTSQEWQKAWRLCKATQQSVALFCGDIWWPLKNGVRYGISPLENDLEREDINNHLAKFGLTPNWISDSTCITLDGRGHTITYTLKAGFALSTAYITECYCGAVGIEMPHGVYPCDESCQGQATPGTNRLLNAYQAARQARFEHGESHQ